MNIHVCTLVTDRLLSNASLAMILNTRQYILEKFRDMSEAIKFYRVDDDYGEFSNFARFVIKIKGKTWQTTEHYFQAMKFKSDADREAVRGANNPMQAARMGRDRKRKLRPDWEGIKDRIMREAILAKFTQHEELASLLLSTGDAKLIEHTQNDRYWGDGGDGRGKNMLGTILMEVREIIRSA